MDNLTLTVSIFSKGKTNFITQGTKLLKTQLLEKNNTFLKGLVKGAQDEYQVLYQQEPLPITKSNIKKILSHIWEAFTENPNQLDDLTCSSGLLAYIDQHLE